MAHGRKTDQQRIRAAERRGKALAYRKAGASYRAIADALGCSVGTAAHDVAAALATLAEQQQGEAAALRTLEAERLDTLQLGLWPKATSGDVGAVLAILKISERRARLFGLDLQPGALL